MASKASGGLGVGCIHAQNLALLGKWKWRLHSDSNALWNKVIKDLYGDGGDQFNRFGASKGRSIWKRIVDSWEEIEKLGILFKNSVAKEGLLFNSTSNPACNKPARGNSKETQPKRPREPESEQQQEGFFPCEIETTKRHKNSSYNQILSILDDNTEEEEDEQHQDLNDFFTALQQELDPFPEEVAGKPDESAAGKPEETEDGDDDKERVIRHLLEASDDELGIPNRVADGDDGGGIIAAGEEGGFPVGLGGGDGLWELEDEAANYYTLLHSELIM
ncbi:hypothetical protein OSB04_021535 [Centaurea solstitialis]|uniref:RNA-directed DNA polymerase, eukaryota, reverse transcriptase zinc-binding domain protein n=1 Tax=Centaurea solstitialis TaxID=347529 RepID=A0AA38W508_9ASTR|nr:hypothetical protein OSB04_021535 [Centaurea solstitialis]